MNPIQATRQLICQLVSSPRASLRLLLVCVVGAMTVAAQPALAAGDAAAGQAKSAVCAACHGADGKALQPTYPNLAGQHASYLAKQLTEYRDGDRVNVLMSGQATNLSDQDILDLAAYYSEMPIIANVAAEENLALGEAIYRGGITAQGIAACSACHGPAGLGNPGAVYPVLSGQNTGYTADQLRQWRAGERNNDPNNVMGSLSRRLTDIEIEAVSNYIQGLYAASN
jgi:cytochrome c553